MESGLVRPVSLAVTDPVARVAETAPAGGRTELPQAKTVQQSAEAASPQSGKKEPAVAAPLEGRPIQSGYSTDKHSGELVFRSVDKQTGEVILQIPSEEILRLRQVYSEKASGSTASERTVDRQI